MLLGSIYKSSFLRACAPARTLAAVPTRPRPHTVLACTCPHWPHTAPARPHCARTLTPAPAPARPHLHSHPHARTLHPHPCLHARTHTRTGVHYDTSPVTLEASTLAFTPSPASHTLLLACAPSLASHPLAGVETSSNARSASCVELAKELAAVYNEREKMRGKTLEKNMSITIAKLEKNLQMPESAGEGVRRQS